MNWQHLRALLWLQSRLYSNRLRRSGTGGMVIEAVISFLSVSAGAFFFLIGLAIGYFALRRASPPAVMFAWDGVVAACTFLWMGELLTEMQRSEAVGLDKFLHLPVSPSGLFLINYASSFFTLTVNLFLPLMMGLSLGLVFSKGIVMLSLFPMVAAFFLMITAVVHQFRGWLASLMENKRRRRNIVTAAMLGFVLITQLPSILIMTTRPSRAAEAAVQEALGELDASLAARQLDAGEYKEKSDAIYKKFRVPRGRPGTIRQELMRQATNISMFVPLGWIAYGARALLEQTILPALLTMLGMFSIAAFCLARSHRTTVMLYTGRFTGGRTALRNPAIPKKDIAESKSSAAFMEKKLPGISDHPSAIALATFRSLLRAPEVKMMLLTPISFTVVFGFMFLRVGNTPAEFMRPLMAVGAMAMNLFGLSQLSGNQFGLDRNGFRALVLVPAPRIDILLGKNLALSPFGLGFGIFSTTVIQVFYPMQAEHFIAVMVQTCSMYVVFCVLSNFLSMFAPMALPSASLRPAKPKGTAILLHVVFFFTFPASMALTSIPLGIAFLLRPFPVYLSLAVAELALILCLYSRVLKAQGHLLQMREQKILEVVTGHIE